MIKLSDKQLINFLQGQVTAQQNKIRELNRRVQQYESKKQAMIDKANAEYHATNEYTRLIGKIKFWHDSYVMLYKEVAKMLVNNRGKNMTAQSILFEWDILRKKFDDKVEEHNNAEKE